MVMRVVLVADGSPHQTIRDFGENSRLFRQLRASGVDLWMVCPRRFREQLRMEFRHDDDFNRIIFVEPFWLQRSLTTLLGPLPGPIRRPLLAPVARLNYQLRARAIVRLLVRQLGVQLVFQPTPNPLSLLHGLGVPVVVGPLAPASSLARLRQWGNGVLHWLLPGKLQADSLIVGDQSALEALPTGYRGWFFQLEHQQRVRVYRVQHLLSIFEQTLARFRFRQALHQHQGSLDGGDPQVLNT